MAAGQALQTDGKLDVAAADDVLNLKVRELGIEAELLNDARIFAAGQLAIILRLGTRHDHLAGSEDERRGLGFSNAHDDGCETLRIVLCVSSVQGDGLEIQPTVEIHGRDDVLQRGHDTYSFDVSDALYSERSPQAQAHQTPRSRLVLVWQLELRESPHCLVRVARHSLLAVVHSCHSWTPVATRLEVSSGLARRERTVTEAQRTAWPRPRSADD